ncbi:MAG: hypothetical protein KIB40_12425 [Pantoea sp.]|uniref:Uncharacterized protein n=1 Tax=Pantoea brenneri TaxID=472694 RepID=A0AAX3JC71_9GAMM|nr:MULTISPECIES: hypothetical protein [Pantoea]MBS6033930.1 hypothetical protein [Pantoea sp.]VXC60506.1 conserved hypothetical protein [Pantoea brenneri]
MNTEKVLIQLINLDDCIEGALVKENFEVYDSEINGLLSKTKDNPNEIIRVNKLTPANIHEMDYIVISNESRPAKKNTGKGFFQFTTKDNSKFINLTSFDMLHIMDSLQDNTSPQCIIFFAQKYYSSTLNRVNISYRDGEKKDKRFTVDSLGYQSFEESNAKSKVGSIFVEPAHQDDRLTGIIKLIKKYETNSKYGVAYTLNDNLSRALMLSKSKEIIAKYEVINSKIFLYLPDIHNKKEFLLELFTSVLPEVDIPFFSDTLKNFGRFKWANAYEYISHEEKLKTISIQKEIKNHNDRLFKLQSELNEISQREENLWVKSLLVDQSNELVTSVYKFLKYIGFENISLPDDSVSVDGLFEEDINIKLSENFSYIIECKGIGGTSQDSDCSQPDKIALRKRDAAERSGLLDYTFRAIYIVNHQRFKAPEERDNPPFKGSQIDDARIANRGMTTCYELFKVYNMIKAAILTPEEARDCFKQTGLINFRKKLAPLYCDEKFPGGKIYSFDLKKTPTARIVKTGKIIIEDNENHWHVLDILSLEVNNKPVDEATKDDDASAGVKVSKLVSNIKNFYTFV